jgi:hypothetical protein
MTAPMTRIISIILFTLLTLLSPAQTSGPVMADSMREDGKIYVVIGVIAVIFISIVLFLVFIERKLARLEKRLGVTRENKENK